jgi:hypothetical protein
MHWAERAQLQQESERSKNELKMLRIEHSELVSNTNIGD